MGEQCILVGNVGAVGVRRKQLSLVAAIMGSFVAGLDSTAVNVALPAIRANLGGGSRASSGCPMPICSRSGSLILVGGSLGDMFGERRMFSSVSAGFGASPCCARSRRASGCWSRPRAAGRVRRAAHPERARGDRRRVPAEERGAAIGTWTAWGGIATVVGPLAGGYLVDAVSWRLIFAINVPFVVATWCSSIAVPRAHGARRTRLDWLGAALTFSASPGRCSRSSVSPGRLGQPAGLGPRARRLVLLAFFLVHERRTPAPMLPLGPVPAAQLRVGNVQTLAMYGGLGLMFFLLVLFLQEVAGYTALAAGLAMLPTTLVMFVLSKRWGSSPTVRAAPVHGLARWSRRSAWR